MDKSINAGGGLDNYLKKKNAATRELSASVVPFTKLTCCIMSLSNDHTDKLTKSRNLRSNKTEGDLQL